MNTSVPTLHSVKCKADIEATKKLRAMMFILEHPEGVTEKSINHAAKVMSGRNYPTHLQRRYGIMLSQPKERRKSEDGSLYTVYKLKGPKEARKLAALIIRHCRKHHLVLPDKGYLVKLADRFVNRN